MVTLNKRCFAVSQQIQFYFCNMRFLWTVVFAFAFTLCFGQNQKATDTADAWLTVNNFDDSYRGENEIRIGFWNLENLFHPSDDSLKNDDSFTPSGNNHFNWYKYNKKLKNLSKVITAVGGWEPIEIMGFCEVENKQVVEDLIYNTPLKKTNYGIIHVESPDNRGIDVALIYNRDKIKIDTFQAITVDFLEPDSRPTRDILHVEALFRKKKIHIFINHWPSRYGGHLVTVPKRNRAADILRSHVDSVFRSEPNANIAILGDFNDHPNDESMLEHLHAKTDTANLPDTALYNMMWPKMGSEGTHKYQGHWGILDQIVISGNLLHGTNGFKTTPENAVIFKAPFLLEEDRTHLGKKLNRTYIGMRYNGGYSDHLPILLDLQFLEKQAVK